MVQFKALATAAVLSALVPASAALDVDSKTNVAVYWVSTLMTQTLAFKLLTPLIRAKVPTSNVLPTFVRRRRWTSLTWPL